MKVPKSLFCRLRTGFFTPRFLLSFLLAAFFALPARADIVTLTAADNGKQVQLRVGDQLVVRLPTSTRYGWRAAQVYPGQLTFVSSSALPGVSSGVPGAPATHQMRFQAIGTGGLDLTLIAAVPGGGYSPLGSYFHVYVTIDQPGVAKNVNITEYGNHSRVKVNQGDQLQIRLSTTAGSPNAWEVMPLEDDIVKLVSGAPAAPSKKARKKKAKAGSPEEVTFQFQALKPGQTTVRFLYRSITDNDAPPVRDFELQVEVPEPPK
ncbi:protease inhibitor I42 family protein [Hymenobacter sp. BT175]|uniref:protease inhibitor I42 family protein n=1 Tax=Hymenobacter translucens TaxID=2886507 RepID=UPI001D0EC132|nr:protease inhibitor I42 family protein [Hymenobacter translucens]MCC2547791.1 protease inhibitor I42 family protein [Hymenobacter translucens]